MMERNCSALVEVPALWVLLVASESTPFVFLALSQSLGFVGAETCKQRQAKAVRVETKCCYTTSRIFIDGIIKQPTCLPSNEQVINTYLHVQRTKSRIMWLLSQISAFIDQNLHTVLIKCCRLTLTSPPEPFIQWSVDLIASDNKSLMWPEVKGLPMIC